MTGWLILSDGSVYKGEYSGPLKTTITQLVVNTAMTGYQEAITDPSYTGEAILFTYPEIGNYGWTYWRSEGFNHCDAVVCRKISRTFSSRDNGASCSMHWHLTDLYKVPVLEGVDTRDITRKLIKLKNNTVIICSNEHNVEYYKKHVSEYKGLPTMDRIRLAQSYQPEWSLGRRTEHTGLGNVLIVDYGIKSSLWSQVANRFKNVVTVNSLKSISNEMRETADIIFLSNGPGDPRDLKSEIVEVRRLIGSGANVRGVCLGHQLISLALGAEIERLSFGHHGCNHPVKDLETGKINITSQNHNYAVKDSSLHDLNEVEVTQVNLNDYSIEGIQSHSGRVQSLQFHPEAAPGPSDASYLLDRILC